MAIKKIIMESVANEFKEWTENLSNPDSDEVIKDEIKNASIYERSRPGKTQTLLASTALELNEQNGGLILARAFDIFTHHVDVGRLLELELKGFSIDRCVTDFKSRIEENFLWNDEKPDNSLLFRAKANLRDLYFRKYFIF